MAEVKKSNVPDGYKATVRIQIPLLEDGDTEKIDQDVPITLNGKTLIIKRGEVVDLPVDYYLVLRESGRFNNL